MKIRNRIINVLLIMGAILYIVVRFIIIPDSVRKEMEYNKAQYNAVTHNLNSILPYKSPYMGDASNIINLYNNLPMTVDRTFQLLSDELTLVIYYKDTFLQVGEKSVEMQEDETNDSNGKQNQVYQDEVFKDLIYNSTAAFALIDNLKKINYNFTDINYSVTRDMIEELYTVKLSELLTEKNWSVLVQDKLKDSEFVNNSMNIFAIETY
ncbi:DUF4825 domain-containing protein [Anaerocolumna sp. MB42-C2]|uniref:DUF4825 domain-containing protein n=1 Tax=Anaerocolumna sp. MB42-C2 TaxID=3070997 RepID=UPI0027DFF6EF|nr:DUF4825 domain-containing protein [Anaerocolumna sp. MB42-C2]WMJ87381.1 DUF4825 domain-containing protein [Anaerocolumna sp. MB42-C2]